MTCDSNFSLAPYYDQTVAGPPHYQFPFCPEPDYGTRPLPLDESLQSIPNSVRRLTDERLKCDKNLGWSIDWATAFLVDHLDAQNNPDISDRLRKISIRASQLAQEGRKKQVVYRAFGVLNQLLFAGHLKDAVYLSFGHLGPDTSGATFSHGQGPNRRVRRISVILNSDLLPMLSGPHLLSSLIHHMIHAYFLVACGPQDEKEVEYGRLDHGAPFTKIMNTIKELGRSRGRVWLPGLSIIQRYPKRALFDGYYPERRPRRKSQEWFSSHCPAKLAAMADCDVEKWYGGVCKPLFDLPDAVRSSTVTIFNKRNELEEVKRGQTTPSADSVEFLFEDRPYLVPGSNIDALISIRRAFEKLGHRYMKVEEVSREGFMLLLELLHTGTYAPDIGPVAAVGRQGPPVIKPTRPGSPPFLINDITLFKTGAQLGFEDLLGFALGRMRAQVVSHEDPIAVLAAIYTGKDPHPDIRQWAKDFLVRAPANEGDWSVGLARAKPDHIEAPNLVKLKMEMCFRERFVELLDSCGALHIDVLKAEEMLVAAGRMGSGSPSRALLPAPYAHGLPIAGVNVGVGVGAVPPLGVGVAPQPLLLGPATALHLQGRGLGVAVPAWREDIAVDEYGRYRDGATAEYAAQFGIGVEDARWPY